LQAIDDKNNTKMQIPIKYLPNQIENKWYNYWMQHNYFHSEPNEKEPYTIVIPPPNVTGVLHMGHMLNNTIQDVLIRRARLKGFNACWVPGTDHASIATEAKVVAKLAEEGIPKSKLTREEFLEHAWDWTHKHGGVILEQLKKLGASCDWERTKFTLDDDLSESVIDTFIDLFNKGLIYRGYRMVNWDPEAKTTLSDEEVEYIEKQGKLYYLNYKIENSDEVVTIATTRPETILGDTAVCINPNDERFKHLKGKNVIVPIVDRVIPIIEDDYVDMEFGTGCLKITPAHDPNDKVIGEKHNLEVIDIFNDDATLNSYGLHYEGQDRFVVRKAIVAELQEKGFINRIEDYTNKVGVSERTKAVIEPKISAQWFLKMTEIVKPAIKAVKDGEINFFPKHYVNTYNHWLENIRDWNISRQLWWGQQIPAYYYGDGVTDFVIAKSKEDALILAKEKTGNNQLNIENLRQDDDVLDTWFSSWLWPISVFDGIRNPNNKEIEYYYPTNDLVTAPDIIFFWVARMIFAGYEFRDAKPFSNVYFTGIVRDKQRRKMSKSLGNSPDPIKLMEEYGADGVRTGLLLASAAGNDLLFEEELCQQGRGFANKIWNGFRLVKGWEVSDKIEQPKAAKVAIEWYEAKFQQALESIEKSFEQYRLSEALMTIYKLLWDDFSSWYLEMVKPAFGQPIDSKTLQASIRFFEDNMKILHPFMPFITEEIWQLIAERTPEQALIISSYPAIKEYNEQLINDFELVKDIVSNIRTIRKDKNISFKNTIDLAVMNTDNFTRDFDSVITKMGNIASLDYISEKLDAALSFRVKSNEYFIPMGDAIDTEAEKAKIEEELKYTQGFLKSVQGKLSNDRFVANAPEKVVAIERKKEAEALAKIEALKASLRNL
jgi:valyl-tRNA synthetase